jgi:hypothetical protein
VVEFDHFKTQTGLPNFVLSATEWIEKTNDVGSIEKRGNTKVPMHDCDNP